MTMLFKSSKQWQPEGRPKIITAFIASPRGYVSSVHDGVHGMWHLTTMVFELSKQWRPEGRQKINTALIASPPGCVSARKRQCMMAIMAIFLSLSWELYCQWKSKRGTQAMVADRKTYWQHLLGAWVRAGECKQSLPTYQQCESKTCYQ